MEKKYNDNDYKIIEKKIINAVNHNEVLDIIQTTFPNWIVNCSKKYSDDYKHFQNNWEFVTKKIKKQTKTECKPLDIILVNYIDNSNRIITLFTEILTIFGHSVRRFNEFICCPTCGNCIPNKHIYNQLKERKISVPTQWSSKCSTC